MRVQKDIEKDLHRRRTCCEIISREEHMHTHTHAHKFGFGTTNWMLRSAIFIWLLWVDFCPTNRGNLRLQKWRFMGGILRVYRSKLIQSWFFLLSREQFQRKQQKSSQIQLNTHKKNTNEPFSSILIYFGSHTKHRWPCTDLLIYSAPIFYNTSH